MKKRRKLAIAAALLFALVVTMLSAAWFLSPDPQVIPSGIGDMDSAQLDRVIQSAQRCNDAYHDHDTFRREYGSQVQAGEFPKSGLRIYYDPNPTGKAQWVILRGTANLPNVFDDLDFVGRGEHELGINVHKGFDQSLQESLPWILERLDLTRPVWVTGHSLGGSVAALLIAVLDHRGYQNVSGITFGQPKLTDLHGAERMENLKLLRAVHREDPIPMLPPVFVEIGELGVFHHSGPEVLVHSDGRLAYLREHNADRLNVKSYWADLQKIKPEAHDMTKGYLPALKLAREQQANSGPAD
jgi:hypothetical protein